MNFIDLNKQYLMHKQQIDLAIRKVLEKGNFIMGEEVEIFEDMLEKYVEAHSTTVANGTDALYIALRSIDIKPGDEVILPSFTWVSTAEVVKLLDAKPIFCDVSLDTFNTDLSHIEEKITERTKAIIPVSIFGQCSDLDQIVGFSRDKNIVVIEDAAQSFGATHNGKKSCSIADISTTSFFPAKPLGCYGDGGAIFCTNERYQEKISTIPRHGQKGRYNYVELGMNSRLDTIQASILIEKLKIFPQEIIERQKIAKLYEERIDQIKGCRAPIIREENTSVYAQYTILLDENIDRTKLMELMKKHGVPTALYYPVALHTTQVYKQDVDLKNTTDICPRVMSLPMHPYLEEDEIDIICNILESSLKSL